MVLDQNLSRLGPTASGDEPTRALGDEPDEKDLDHGGDTLKETRDPPRPRAFNVLGPVRRPRGHNGPEVPRSREVGQDGPAMFWKSQLGEKQGGAHNGESQAPADQEARDDELRHMLGRGLEDGAEERPQGAKGDGLAAAELVDEPADQGQGEHGADSLDGVEEAEDGGTGVVEF